MPLLPMEPLIPELRWTSPGRPRDADVRETSLERLWDVLAAAGRRLSDGGAGTSAGHLPDGLLTSAGTSTRRPMRIERPSVRTGLRGVLRAPERVSERRHPAVTWVSRGHPITGTP